MKLALTYLLAISAGTLLPRLAVADILFDVRATAAPNFFGATASYNAWEANAMAGLAAGSATFGSAGTPGFWYAFPNNSTQPASLNLATNFPAFNGQANPAAPFNTDLGNRLQFGVRIRATAGEFFNLDSFIGNTFVNGVLDSVLQGPFTGFNYTPWRIGINYGVDGAPGGGDDVVYQGNEVGTLLVNEIIYSGQGLGFEALTSGPGVTLQDKIDIAASTGYSVATEYAVNVLNALGSPTGVTATSSLVTVNFAAVPEPGTVVAGVLGVAFVAGALSRRRSAKI